MFSIPVRHMDILNWLLENWKCQNVSLDDINIYSGIDTQTLFLYNPLCVIQVCVVVVCVLLG